MSCERTCILNLVTAGFQTLSALSLDAILPPCVAVPQSLAFRSRSFSLTVRISLISAFIGSVSILAHSLEGATASVTILGR